MTTKLREVSEVTFTEKRFYFLQNCEYEQCLLYYPEDAKCIKIPMQSTLKLMKFLKIVFFRSFGYETL